MREKKFQPIIFAALIICGIIIGANLNPKKTKTETSKVNSILELIESHYVDTLKIDFDDKIINSIIKDLDPHTSYIPKKQYQAVSENMLGGFSGIGIEFNIIEDTIVVVSPITGGPSEKLGIISGDRIITVDNVNVAGIGIENNSVVKKLRGEKGTDVKIQIKRRGLNRLIGFTITRNTIPINSIDVAMMITPTVGFIKLNRFSAKTISEFRKETAKLLNQGMQELIFDLRDNPGGYLSAAASICDDLLEKNSLIVYTKGRNRDRNEIISSGKSRLEKIKLVILINEGSASASEIIAGAIQDNDRGILVGRRSFGKGLVQEEIKLSDGSAIRLTTQRYYTPSGRSIQKDYEKNNNDYFLEQYLRNDTVLPDSLKFKTKNGRIVFGGGGINPDIIIKRDTSINYKIINEIIINGWIRDFSMKYSDLNRKKTSTIINSSEYLKQIEEIIYKQFINHINQNDSTFNVKVNQKEKDFLKRQVIANITRNLWNNEDYYRVLMEKDQYVNKALEELSIKY